MKKIIQMTQIHCARGPKWCSKCKALEDEGKKYALIEIVGRGGKIARPMLNVEIKGENECMEFDVLTVFENEEKAHKYTKENHIEIENS